MTTKTSIAATMETDDQYDRFEAQVAKAVASIGGPLFTSDADPAKLWAAYLDGIPADRRQHYDCHCCRRFVQAYGGLKVMGVLGVAAPALWQFDPSPSFRASVAGLSDVVNHAKVNGVFLSSAKVWGSPRTGEWSHLSAVSSRVYADRVKTADQAMAEKREDFRMLSHGLSDYPAAAVDQALRVLKADALDRSEKALGVAEWLAKLHADIATNPSRRSNFVWRAVAEAPPGFCHVRSTMISTLLDDVIAGLPFDAIAKRWADKMHPLRYQRPTAAPSEGAIVQAEKLVDHLGVRPSLGRRFATLADVLAAVWTPPAALAETKRSGGVFDHLRSASKSVAAVELPGGNITWDKFRRTVLPGASSLDVMLPQSGAFYGLLTAADPDAPAIVQWDGLAGQPRNPVSWYFYHGGSTPASWNVSPGWAKVTAVFLAPHQWQEPTKFAHQGLNVHFAVDGAWDTRGPSLCLFPEILKSEFHGIRSVVEAHSNRTKVENPQAGNANGLAFQKQGPPVTVRVGDAGGRTTYTIDRMD